MTADDTSREALIERLRVAMLGTTDGDFIEPESDVPAGEMFRLAAEWVDAVVMPLVQERDRLIELARDRERWSARADAADFQRDRAIKRAEAAEAELERLRDRQRDVPVFHCETHLCGHCAGCKRAGVLDDNTRLRKRAEAAEAAHEKLTEAVLCYAASYEDFPNKTVTERLIAPTLRQVGKDLRHILDEHGAPE